MEQIARGAEAVLYRKDNELVKARIEKGYRLRELDAKLRTERTKTEARLMDAARRAGVPVPMIREVRESTLKMDFLEGERLRDAIDLVDSKQRIIIANTIGRHVGRLHRNGIVHGDLTTSNMIMHEGRVYFIDFGLGTFSTSVEDRAVDLYLLHNALKSTHYKNLKPLWANITKGYKKEFNEGARVLDRLKKVEVRGRYARRLG
ncbi:MAG: Kae1-associated serine/threonine protein kinase [Candidatus Aenigmatarchaeota archaeon]|nr:MAG: Kae1-associated serine/threonine protein kinase [Candidatus Aenigmarchaeota archaeon]